MAARVADALRAWGCDPVVAIGGDAMALHDLGLPAIADNWTGQGPLGGVITALRHFAASAADTRDAAGIVVIAACDLPRVSAATVGALVDALQAAPMSTHVAIATTDRPQPLCAAWRPNAEALLAAAFANGERRILNALETMQVIEVAVDSSFLINVNTADELPR